MPASLQITDRANIVLRVLACLKACGVERGGDDAGERRHPRPCQARAMTRSHNQRRDAISRVAYLDMRVTGTVDDSMRAAAADARGRTCRPSSCSAATAPTAPSVSACGDVPIAGISTGTNNAFPEHREPTITGLAVGLAVCRPDSARDRLSRQQAARSVASTAVREIALVDVAIVTERYVGARALWRTETFRELLVTFADPEVIGMSAIAGLLEPVGRRDAGGLAVELGRRKARPRSPCMAPIAPGYIAPIGISAWRRIKADMPLAPADQAGSIALDGERECPSRSATPLRSRSAESAFRTIDVGACMAYARKPGSSQRARRLNFNDQIILNGRQDTMSKNPFPLSKQDLLKAYRTMRTHPRIRGAAARRIRQGRHSGLRPSLCRGGGLGRRHHDASRTTATASPRPIAAMATASPRASTSAR